ncbi:luciferase [Terasakiispira papahanaumokuakeensis]|uniref:Luciferase-like monooxygenase n=1 Tax=Terasakiispira papahanaumokuakeensis TaxID=197479 RepID=A0A1E2V7V9_9GAMM|nr:LLM class flavin-dependent oxidoreductase [Terasakiispira papahanaumokuakeensis]ODC03099.1 luciferase [Terasakiispira papahanaumokuakeensis]
MSKLQEIPLSVLDLVPIRDQGSIAEALDQSRQLARQVDQLGFNRFWLAEHHNIDGIASAATSVLIGHIAGSTERIRVGSGGIMLPNHSPLVIAEQFGTLETLYPHRIDLGLGRAPGSDHATMRAIGRHMDAGVTDFPERLADLRRYLDDAQPGQRVKAIPGQGTHVPIWLLGSSGYSAQLAAQLGLPFAFAAQFAPGYLDEALHLYRQQFQPSEVLDEPYAMVGMPVIVADTDEQARYLGTTAQQKFLNLIRGQRTRSLPPVTRVEASPHEMAMVNQHLGAAVVGSAETVREGLEAFLDRTQADELMVVTDVYDSEARAHSFELLAQLWQSPER